MKNLPNPLCIVLAVLALSAGGPASAAELVERSAPADPRGRVEIVNVAGKVRVQGWDRAEVRLEARLESGVERVDFETRGDRTFIEVVQGQRRGPGSASLVVRIPRDSTLTVNTVSADQDIEDVRGEQRLQAVSGSIATHMGSEDLDARTVSGEITVRGRKSAGLATITTVSGQMELIDLAGEIVLQTVNGDMRVDMDQLERARIRSTNGDAMLRAILAPDARVDVEAVNGDMTLAFRGKVDAEFDIETFNGPIDNCFGHEPVRLRRHGPGYALRFKEGDGRARVRVKTLNGSVDVCAK